MLFRQEPERIEIPVHLEEQQATGARRRGTPCACEQTLTHSASSPGAQRKQHEPCKNKYGAGITSGSERKMPDDPLFPAILPTRLYV